MWSNVEERITDGTSGLAPKSQPVVLFAGVSSKGALATPLVFGRRTGIKDVLGYGPLANTLADCQKNMDDVSVLAVCTEADIEGGVSAVIGSEGAGTMSVAGTPAFAASIKVECLSAEEARITFTGDKNASYTVALPENRSLGLADIGLTALLPAGASAGQYWAFTATAPSSTFEALKRGVDAALELYIPEAVIICQNANAEDAALWSAEAETYFGAEHKPILFILQTELEPAKVAASPPSLAGAVYVPSRSYEEAIAAKAAEFSKIDARFVSVLCQPGTIIEGSLKHSRQPLGYLAATLTKAAVNQSIGATRFFAVPNFAFPEGWTNTHSQALDEARFITLRTYAGLNGIFWSNGRTLGGNTSDYRFIEVVRTVHKAVRLARLASLPHMQAPGGTAGIKEVLASIRQKLSLMTGSSPAELLAFELDAAPEGQDIVNNGLLVGISLYGVPIIRKIVLDFQFKYKQGA